MYVHEVLNQEKDGDYYIALGIDDIEWKSLKG